VVATAAVAAAVGKWRLANVSSWFTFA